MGKVIYVESEIELRELFDLQNRKLNNGDEIILKKNITLTSNLSINKNISIVLSDGIRFSTGKYRLHFAKKCNLR